MKSNSTVMIKPMGSPSYSVSVKPGQAVSNGDAIRVGDASFAVVIFLDDKSVVKIRENTDFQFVETSNTRSLIIDQGTTLHNVNKEDRKKTYRVETPVSVASVKGTEFSSFHDAVSGVDKFVGKSGNFEVGINFNVDQLSGLYLLVITGLGFLIHVYSLGYMKGEEGYYRFFAYLNLFVFFMLILVLGDGFLLMFVGWEGVGLCSYLLIGYYFDKKP